MVLPKMDFKLNVFTFAMVIATAIVFVIRGEGQIDLLRNRVETVERTVPGAVADIRQDLQSLTREVIQLREQMARNEGRQERYRKTGGN